jgi:hypothetical protein
MKARLAAVKSTSNGSGSAMGKLMRQVMRKTSCW